MTPHRHMMTLFINVQSAVHASDRKERAASFDDIPPTINVDTK